MEDEVVDAGIPAASVLRFSSSFKMPSSTHSTPRKSTQRSVSRKGPQQKTLEGYLTTEQPLKHQLVSEKDGSADFSPQHDTRSLMSFAMPVQPHDGAVVTSPFSLLGADFSPSGGPAEIADESVEPLGGEAVSSLLDGRRTNLSGENRSPLQNSEWNPSPLIISEASSSGSPVPRLELPGDVQSSPATMVPAIHVASVSPEYTARLPPGTEGAMNDENAHLSSPEQSDSPELQSRLNSCPNGDCDDQYPNLRVTSGEEDNVDEMEQQARGQQQRASAEEEEEDSVPRVSVPATEDDGSPSGSSKGPRRHSPDSQSDRADSDSGLQVRLSNGDRRTPSKSEEDRMEALLSARWQREESAMWPAGLSSTEEDTEGELRDGIRVRVSKDSRRGLRLGGKRRSGAHQRRDVGEDSFLRRRGISSPHFPTKKAVTSVEASEGEHGGVCNGQAAKGLLPHGEAGRPRRALSPRAVPSASQTPEGKDQGTEVSAFSSATKANVPEKTEGQMVGASENMSVLRCASTAAGGEECVVFLVGTAHVSKESCEEVRKIIQLVKPDVVFLELCPERVAMLLPQEDLQVPSMTEVMQALRERRANAFSVIYSWMLAKVADKVEVLPGAEFRAAYEEAAACGAMVKLGDRPVQVTLRRTWALLSRWHKFKLIMMLLLQAIWLPSKSELEDLVEQMKQGDMLALAVDELGKSFPTLVQTLIHERDLFMTAMLQHVAQRSSAVVAVVGKGHLKGIEGNWNQKDIDVKSLLVLPPDPPLLSASFKRWAALTMVVSSTALIVTLRYYRRPL